MYSSQLIGNATGDVGITQPVMTHTRYKVGIDIYQSMISIRLSIISKKPGQFGQFRPEIYALGGHHCSRSNTTFTFQALWISCMLLLTHLAPMSG